MELFTEAATDHEFSAITGQIPGEAQKKQVREQLENNPEANAECMAWLYTLRGDRRRSVGNPENPPEGPRGGTRAEIRHGGPGS